MPETTIKCPGDEDSCLALQGSCGDCAPPEVDYPEDHSPFCHRDCTHPCHDAYDEWAAENGRSEP